MGHKMGHKRTRGKGEGAVFKRSDGYWMGRVEAGRTPEGKRRRLTVVRKRKADVLSALDDLKRLAEQGVVPDRSRTLAAFLDWWLDTVVAGDVTESSMREYRKRVARIKRAIGHVRLDKLGPLHVQSFATALAQQYPRSPKTVASTLSTLKRALRYAVGAELLARNPAEHVKPPRKAQATKIDDAMTAAEAEAVLAAARDDHALGAFWWLAMTYGLRIGELMALQWSDVDLDGRQLTVRRSKTAAGQRTVPLTDEAAAVLRDHRRRQKVASVAGLVFSRPDGRALSGQYIGPLWTELLTRAGVAHVCRNCGTDTPCSTSVRRFHASRHTAATLLLNRGVKLEVVSAILGHASLAITSDIYARVRGDLVRSAFGDLDG
jgi:integrase